MIRSQEAKARARARNREDRCARKAKDPDGFRARERAYYQANRKRILAKRVERERDPLVRARVNERMRAYRARNPERFKRFYVTRNAKRYGLSAAEFAKMVERQSGLCAICGNVPRGAHNFRSFHIDHNHATGAVRGLLCGSCNNGLGRFRDNPALLLKAAAYLERHKPSLGVTLA